jgi:hypothetical protein
MILQEFMHLMKEDALSLEDVLQYNQGAPTVCELASKGCKEQSASMKYSREPR